MSDVVRQIEAGKKQDAATPVERVIARIKGVYGRWNKDTTVQEMRADWDDLFKSQSAKVHAEQIDANGVEAEWVSGLGCRHDRAILYFHGGGYQIGSTTSHRAFVARLAEIAGYRALSVNYRLAPENKFPAALNDATVAYLWLLKQGFAAKDIAIAGDSAGGGLALATMYWCRDNGYPLPAAGVMLSPWTDMTAAGESYASRAAMDPIHQRPMILAMARRYLGESGDPQNPLASPIFGDPSGFPPLLFQVGGRETVLDDAKKFAEAAEAAGVEAQCEIWKGMIHVFQMYHEDIPEARQAIDTIGRFIRKHLR